MFSSSRSFCVWPMFSALVITSGCDLSGQSASETEGSSPLEPPALKVNVIAVEPSENVFQTAISFGTLRPNRSTYLSFAKGGRVAEVFVAVGDKVDEDQKLAELEQAAIEEQRQNVTDSIESIQQSLARLDRNSRSSATQNQISRFEQQLTSLDAQQRELEAELGKGIISAPFAGIVAGITTDSGIEIPPGKPAIKLVDSAAPIVELEVSEKLAQQISIQQPAWIVFDERMLEARVASKSPELSPSSLTQMVTLELVDNDLDYDWVYGETVEARFWIPSDESGFWLPYSSLQRDYDGLWATSVVEQKDDQQIVERRIVEIVQLAEDYALVSGAIVRGDKVIVDGSNRIVPGQEVKPRIVLTSISQIGPPNSRAGVSESTE